MLKKKLSIITAILIAASAPITWNAAAQESPELPPAPEIQKTPVGNLKLTDEQKTQLKNILSEEQYQKLVRLDESKKDFATKKRAMDAHQKKIGFERKGNFAHAKKGRAFRNHSAPDQPCAMVRQGRDFPGKMMARNHGPMMKGQRNRFMDDSFQGQNAPRKMAAKAHPNHGLQMSRNSFQPKNRGMERKMKRG